MKAVEKLRLSIVSHTGNNTNSLKSIVDSCKTLSKNEKLTHLSLNLKRWSQDMGQLADGLAEFKNLKFLELNLDWCE